MPHTPPAPASAGPSRPENEQAQGLVAALSAFVMWGVLPIYWKTLIFIAPLTIMLHRVIWSFAFLLLLEIKAGRLRSTLAALKDKRAAALTATRSLILGLNWLIFIWAVNNGHIVETSLGYFLNPLLNTLCGALFFKERPNFLQGCAILLALTGVGVQVAIFGRLPWIALSLASLFAAYGAMRKADPRRAVSGMFLETALITPLALAGLLWIALSGDITGLGESLPRLLLIMSSGLVTSLPLLLFAHSTQRLSLTTLGLAQYIAPSLTMVIGVFIYQESVTSGHMLSFACIWAALALYTFESLRLYRAATRLHWRKQRD